MQMSDPQRPCILFVSALQEELDAIWRVGSRLNWSDPPEEYEATWFRRSTLKDCDLVTASCGEMGQVAMAILVSKLALKFRPSLVILIGICGGRKDLDFSIGDVIFSNQCSQCHTGRRKISSHSSAFEAIVNRTGREHIN